MIFRRKQSAALAVLLAFLAQSGGQKAFAAETAELPLMVGAAAHNATNSPVGPDPVDAEMKALNQELQNRAQEAMSSTAPLPPSSTSCDTTFLDTLYLNLHEATCRDSTTDGCGHVDWLRIGGISLMAVPMTMSEISMMMNNGHITTGLQQLKGVATSSIRDANAIQSEESLREAFSQLTDAQKKSEFLCVLDSLQSLSKDTGAEGAVSNVKDRVAQEIRKSRRQLLIRLGVLGATSGAMYFQNIIMQKNQLQMMGGSKSCTASLPDGQYYSPERVVQAEQDYKYINMTQGGPSCVPSYRLSKEVMSFIQLPYARQQEILGSSAAVCDYYKGFNDRLVAALKPAGSLSSVKGPSDTNSTFQFSTVPDSSQNTEPTVYSFDYDRQTTFTRQLSVHAPGVAHDIVYDFAKSGSIEVLTRVHYTTAAGEAQDLTPQQLKAESADDPDAKRAMELYRDYQYYHPAVSLCIFQHAENSCVDAWKKAQAAAPNDTGS